MAHPETPQGPRAEASRPDYHAGPPLPPRPNYPARPATGPKAHSARHCLLPTSNSPPSATPKSHRAARRRGSHHPRRPPRCVAPVRVSTSSPPLANRGRVSELDSSARSETSPPGVTAGMPPVKPPPPPRLVLNGVSCMRNAQTVLRDINVSVHDGTALVLTGANGSGKTTFLRMLAGFSRPSAGEILWNGHDVTSPGVFQQYKLQLNWMSLKDAVKEKLTVLENVQWFELLEGKHGKSAPAIELMGLGRLMNEKARMLSMGQRKRLQLARLLAIDRPIWLLDEPSVALDSEGVKLLEYIIMEHRKKGGIVFVATHLPIAIEDSMSLRLPQRFPRRKTLVDLVR